MSDDDYKRYLQMIEDTWGPAPKSHKIAIGVLLVTAVLLVIILIVRVT